MTRVLPRTNFHSSKLVRCLADLGIADVVEPGDAFAEQLGLWIHFADAIALSAVHSDSMASPSNIQPAVQVAAHAAAEFERVKAGLMHSIVKSCSPNSGKTHITLPGQEPELPTDMALAYAPYRRFYEAHQRDMALRIQPLRVNVREAVAKTSPRLRKLAELDAAFEKILRDRESKLLSKVPVLLGRRFEQLFKEHQQKLVDTQQADNPPGWMQADGWLARFCNDMKMLLLAELELRLQPAMGLIEAFKQDTE